MNDKYTQILTNIIGQSGNEIAKAITILSNIEADPESNELINQATNSLHTAMGVIELVPDNE